MPTLQRNERATGYLKRKKTVRSRPDVRTPEWEEAPRELREAAFFSAAVENARLLQTMQDKLLQSVALAREKLANGKEAFVTRASFVSDMRALALDQGLTPRDPRQRGTIQDITSLGRLGLIFDFQRQSAAGYAQYMADMNPGALDEFPAYEFVRVAGRTNPRPAHYWPERWAKAGGKMYQDRMIALKTSPVWTKLSRFGRPFPPFDFGSGYGLEDVSREECESLGVIKRGQQVQPESASFTDGLTASTRGLEPGLITRLLDRFKGQIEVVNEQLQWKGTAEPPSQMGPSQVAVGQRFTVLNKYGDEIAEGKVTDVERHGFTLDTGDAVLFRHVVEFNRNTVKLSVAS